MKSELSIGIFISAAALFCLTIAVDKYYSAMVTAEVMSKRLHGFELESVGIPTETVVCGAVGVMLLVAGLILIGKSFRAADENLLGETNS